MSDTLGYPLTWILALAVLALVLALYWRKGRDD